MHRRYNFGGLSPPWLLVPTRPLFWTMQCTWLHKKISILAHHRTVHFWRNFLKLTSIEVWWFLKNLLFWRQSHVYLRQAGFSDKGAADEGDDGGGIADQSLSSRMLQFLKPERWKKFLLQKIARFWRFLKVFVWKTEFYGKVRKICGEAYKWRRFRRSPSFSK